ncbi:hypothetical protein J7L05_07080 [bacterium]|nr:hypothetical protein [bacterium]
MEIIDISDPSNPEFISELIIHKVSGIHIENNRAYLAGGFNGFVSVELW